MDKDNNTMFSVSDSLGNIHTFTEYETAQVFLGSLGDAARQILSTDYNCIIDHEYIDVLYIKGRERDRLMIHDRILYLAEVKSISTN